MIAASLIVALQAGAPAESPALAEALARAGAYVVEFQRQLAGLVTEEKYVQTMQTLQLVSGARFVAPAPERRRVLTSDYLLVKPVGASRWIEFRDVFEVDGKPVRDRSERLAKLFLEPTQSIADQVDRIVADSSRYNLSGVVRTVNVPLLPLRFLDPANQHRFRFKRGRSAAPPLSIADAPSALWVIECEEVEKDTFIKTGGNRDLPAHGRFWVEPTTGRVRATELTTSDASLNSRIVVGYRTEPSVGVLVPAEMRERYMSIHGGGTLEGIATYSRVRQFTVSVDEQLAPVVKK
jgi:hypothetical protein